MWRTYTQGFDEPIYVIDEATPRVIARLDEDDQTRAEALANGLMLAATEDLFVQTVRFSECLKSMLHGRFAPTRESLEFFAQEAREAIAKAEGHTRHRNEQAAVGELACACV